MGRKDKPVYTPLRLLRQEAGVSLTTLAERTGYDKGYLSSVETGANRLTLAVLEAYETGLGFSPGILTTRVSILNSSTRTAKLQNTRADSSDRIVHRLSSSLAGRSVFQLVEGARNIMQLSIDLVTAAAHDVVSAGEAILVSQMSERGAFGEATDLRVEWLLALKKALDAGWEVVRIQRSRNEARRSFNPVGDSPAWGQVGGGRYQIYYYQAEDHTHTAPPNDLLIVPRQGALMFLGTLHPAFVNAAFFFSNKKHIQVLSKYFEILKLHTTAFPEKTQSAT